MQYKDYIEYKKALKRFGRDDVAAISMVLPHPPTIIRVPTITPTRLDLRATDMHAYNAISCGRLVDMRLSLALIMMHVCDKDCVLIQAVPGKEPEYMARYHTVFWEKIDTIFGTYLLFPFLSLSLSLSLCIACQVFVIPPCSDI
jgi:hypothetical protein